MSEKRILWIDLLRSICILYIVGLWHMDDYMVVRFDNDFTFQTTYCSLAALMFISGYLAANKQISSMKDTLSYYKGRILRIYPLYVLATITMLITGHNRVDLVLVYLTGIGGAIVSPFPSTLWFVCILFLFYLITPYIMINIKTKKTFVLFVLFEISFVLLCKICNADIRLVYYWPFYYLGIIISYKGYFEEWKDKNISIIGAFILYIMISFNIGSDFTFLTFIVAWSFIYSVSCFFIKIYNKKNISKITNAICYSSMCMYLFHRTILVILKKMNGDMFNMIEAYFICLPIIFIISYFIQYLYDQIIKKFHKPKRT